MATRGGVGDQTRSMVLDTIRARGAVSRVELAEWTGLTGASISHAIRDMLADDLVVELGQSTSTGGKPRTMLGINAVARYALGVTLDRERLVHVVADLAGHLVASVTTAGAADHVPDAVAERIAAEAVALLQDAGVDPARVVGMGVAAPGPLDAAAGRLLGDTPSAAWKGYALGPRLEDLLRLPVVVDNDATCAAFGEFWASSGQETEPVVASVHMADDVGMGILVDGGVFHGASSNAGQIGHVSVDVDGRPCPCGARGCVQTYASPRAVVADALAEDGLAEAIGLTGTAATVRRDYLLIAEAAARDEPRCLRIVTRAARYLGHGLVAACNLLDVRSIFLTGPGFRAAAAIYLRVIQSLLDELAVTRSVHPVRVQLSHIRSEAASLGAAALVLQRELAPFAAVSSRRRQLEAGARAPRGRAVPLPLVKDSRPA